LFTRHADAGALKILEEPVRPLFAKELVQLGTRRETNA
jgi:hypothetical protein